MRLASELTEIQDKRWRPPRRTLLVLQAMSHYLTPLSTIRKTMLQEIIFGLVLCFSTINTDKRITLRPYFDLRSSID